MHTINKLATCLLLGASWSPAYAQQTGTAAAPATSEPTSGDASAEAQSDIGADDIIVTALKRSSSLQKTPAAVSVVSGEDIVERQLVDVRGLGMLIPSSKTNVESTATQFFVRGVGKQYDSGRIPEAVAMVIDGLNIPQQASSLALFDVSSIQVLPGPQGTLYGSSAIGGVVNITTNRPSANSEQSILLDVGNYGLLHATAVTNVPISDDLYVRAAYSGNYRKGYNSNGTADDHATAFRLSALYEPDNSFSFLLTGTYAFNKWDPSPTVPFPFLTNDPYEIRPFDPDTAFFFPPDGGPTGGGRAKIQVGSIATEIKKTLGDVTISYNGGYLRQTTPGGADINTFPVAGFYSIYQHKSDLFNNELRASGGENSRLSWVAGLYQLYYKHSEFLVFGPNLSGSDYTTTTKTYAAYGQMTYSLADATRITGGLRASHDSVASNDDARVFFPTGAPPNFGRGVITFNYKDSWERLNWKVGLEQDISSTSMVYAGVQSGFNPGTYDGNPPNPGAHVQPQSMIGYTVGLKNRLFDNQLTLNFEGFLYNYKDQIVAVADLVSGATRLTNAQRSRIYGLQADASLRVAQNTQLRASLGYLSAKFTDFDYLSGGTLVDYTGKKLPFAPSLTANLGATQTFELAGGQSIVARVDSYISSPFWFSFDNPAGFKQGSYSKTDASITYRSASGNWEVGIWAKNLENSAVGASSGIVPGRSYPGVVFVEPPRTFGGRLQINF